jgi:hypothetical protein
MGQHYTMATTETEAWCNRCFSMTRHRVAGRRLQFCIPCWTRSEAESAAKKKAEAEEADRKSRQGRLF